MLYIEDEGAPRYFPFPKGDGDVGSQDFSAEAFILKRAPTMGIPRLITYLEPYATSAELRGCRVIVDGPGLAYHIFYRLVASKSSADNAILHAPSYRELGESAICFLDELQRCGVFM